MKTSIFVSITLLLVLLNAGCTQQAQNQGTNQTDKAGGTSVVMKNFAFDPAELKIKAGDTVVWTNKDSVPHNLVSPTGSELISPTIPVGGTYSHTFNTAGEYAYSCEIHTGMKGKIIVE
jgi:plastocyanin